MRRTLDRCCYADAGGGHRQLVENALLQIQQPVQPVGWEDRPQEHPIMRAADAVDAAVALHQPHRVPRHVEVDDVAALLQVHALRQHVGRDYEIVKVVVLPLRRLHRNRCEALHGLPARHLGEIARTTDGHHPPPVTRQLRPPPEFAFEEVPYPLDRILEEGEHEHLTLLRLVDRVRRLFFSLLRDLDQFVGQSL